MSLLLYSPYSAPLALAYPILFFSPSFTFRSLTESKHKMYFAFPTTEKNPNFPLQQLCYPFVSKLIKRDT